MSKITSFERQFKGGYFPQEHWDESQVVEGEPVGSPSKTRFRSGVAVGSEQEARPGMVGKQDFSRRKVPSQVQNPSGASSGWWLQQNPEIKINPFNAMSPGETIAQGDGPPHVRKKRRI